MPTGMQGLDIGFPQFEDGSSDTDRLAQIADYLQMLLQNLKYTLSNLGIENFNDQELEEITEPVLKEIKDVEGNVSRLSLTAKGLESRVDNTDGEVVRVKQTAQQASITASNAYGKAQTVEVTVDGLTVTNAEGQTTIDGNCIKSGVIRGVTLASESPGNGCVKLENGRIAVRYNPEDFIELGSLGADYQCFSLRNMMSDYPLKIFGSGNMSIDSSGTIYIGTSGNSIGINIGWAGADVRLIGNVYINGVLQA